MATQKAEPHKIKTVKNLNITDYFERSVLLREAHFNTFNIHSNKVIYEMSSQGTSAKSQEQESGSLIGDEAYAGSRNFQNLRNNVKSVFGHEYVCPTHNKYGCIKLIAAVMTKNESKVISNDSFPELLLKDKHCVLQLNALKNESVFSGNLDPVKVLKLFQSSMPVSFIYMDIFAEGYKPVSPENLREIRKIATDKKVDLILDLSRVVQWATFIQEQIPASPSLAELVSETGLMADVIVMDAGQDARCNAGGLLAAQKEATYEKFMNEVVIYEGLHTYGGMAGRTMESFARGLVEMLRVPQAEWIRNQVNYFSTMLEGLPLIVGADGVYLKTDEFLPQIAAHQAQALSSLLYLKAGIRAALLGKFQNENILPVQIPRLAFTNDQLRFVASAIREVYEEREEMTRFELLNDPDWMDEAEFSWNNPTLKRFNYECEAYRITTIEYVGVTSREERKKINLEQGFNTFLLPSDKVNIDLLTDSGTCAQTTIQWSKYNDAEETQASSRDFFDMVDTLKEVTGYKYIIPTHQGRAAEHIMSQVLIKDGWVPGNMYFTTTKLHQEMAGGTFVDVICDEAHDSSSDFEWKGNIDISKIEKILKDHGEGSIPYISFEFSVNLAGGQPVSMDNAREVYHFCKSHGIPVMFDATRAVENAYMIKKKDSRYMNSSIKEILRELFSYGDGCTVSSKKDYLVNIGGFLGIREDEEFYKKAQAMLRVYEGSRTTGGLSAGDMAMHAEGNAEMLDFNYISARVEQTQYLGNKLLKAGVPVVQPIGTHAVFVDARKFLPHIDQDNYPAQALAAALYVESGIRAMERGNVSSGRNRKTGENYRPKLELVRLTIPRRAYTNAHMDFVADSIIELFKKRDQIKPLEFVYEPENLRFFQGKFREI